MKSHLKLLNRLVQCLVDEWGHEEVAVAIANVKGSSKDNLVGQVTGPKPRTSTRAVKRSAVEQVERAAVEGEQKEALIQLAARYDDKQFLPSVADVREFLIMLGERPSAMKDRQEAFRVLLRTLIQLPFERLRQLACSELYSGPARLGPLSDAIAVASEGLPRHNLSGRTER